MSRRFKWGAGIALVLFAIACWAAANWPQLNLMYANRRVRATLQSLSQCDRLEIVRLGAPSTGGDSGGFSVGGGDGKYQIVWQRRFVGDEVHRWAEFWGRLSLGLEYEKLCHRPAYGFRFFRGTQVQFETTLCFECSNFSMVLFGERGYWGFDADQLVAVQFRTALAEIAEAPDRR